MALGHARRTSAAIAISIGSLAGGLLAAVPSVAAPAPEEPRSVTKQVLLDWQQISADTIYGPLLAPPPTKTPIPTGVPILGFTSLAMYDALQRSLGRAESSEAAAIAAAAHGVLRSYFLADRSTLDTALAETLTDVPDGRAETVGVRVGRRAAARMLESRRADGWADPTIHYQKPTTPGFWQPPTSGPVVGDMLAPWLGSLRYLVLPRDVPADGPPDLDSARYTRDFAQVARMGSATSTDRSQAQSDTTTFFNSNGARLIGDALIERFDSDPVGLRRMGRLFAAMHAAMADSIIRCWELKRDVGFWRPVEAIHRAGEDGNPATSADAGWQSFLPTPPYSDYVSGHGSLVGPAVEVVRRMLGEDTSLDITSANGPETRTFDTLSRIERQAFMSRIWGGLHFRTAMVDAYDIAHRTARIVLRRLP